MTDPIIVEVDHEPRHSASDIEVRGLVRVEEIRLERTKFRSVCAVIIAAIFGFVGTCHAICGPG